MLMINKRNFLRIHCYLKAAKSQRVFSIWSHLQKKSKNYTIEKCEDWMDRIANALVAFTVSSFSSREIFIFKHRIEIVTGSDK